MQGSGTEAEWELHRWSCTFSGQIVLKCQSAIRQPAIRPGKTNAAESQRGKGFEHNRRIGACSCNGNASQHKDPGKPGKKAAAGIGDDLIMHRIDPNHAKGLFVVPNRVNILSPVRVAHSETGRDQQQRPKQGARRDSMQRAVENTVKRRGNDAIRDPICAEIADPCINKGLYKRNNGGRKVKACD